jgi:photosystem II stability/assembly factor-like uncharacterized protein
VPTKSYGHLFREPLTPHYEGLRLTLKGCLATILLIETFSGISCGRPSPGKEIESWETGNNAFNVRITAFSEESGGFVAGAYYVFRSSQAGANQWHEIMTFRHDDPVPIPREQVRFMQEKTAFVFMGWMYAVTMDGGHAWSVWDASKDLPDWTCCNYSLIRDVKIDGDGSGTMTLDPIPGRRGEEPLLRTKDFGQHWNKIPPPAN